MVNRCVAAGCSNTPSDRVSLFRFPKDKVLRNKWEKQVQRTRAKWKVTEHSYLCSEHFTEDSFEVDSEIASKFGLKKRRRLKSGAVPTIFHRPPVSLSDLFVGIIPQCYYTFCTKVSCFFILGNAVQVYYTL